jgi:tRNA(Ile)-lysidine synthase
MNLEAAFSQFLSLHFPLGQSDKVLLAVSGGPDSMALLHLFARLKLPIGVAHCNFSLRGNESDADELLVRNVCQQLKITYHTQTFDTTSYANKHSLSIQMAARDLRYAWFHELLAQYNYRYIATAHHEDDQTETVLMNIIRGTGIKGLKGIPLQNGSIIRPLLFAAKTDLIKYLSTHDFAYREDASNSENKYTRNNLRNSIIPQLNSLNNQAAKHINELSGYAKFADKIIQEKMDALRTALISHLSSSIHLEYEKLSLSNDAPFYLFELICTFGFNTAQCYQIQEAYRMQHTGSRFLSNSHELIIDRKKLVLSERVLSDDEPVRFEIRLLPKQTISTHQSVYHFDLVESDTVTEYLPGHLYLNADLLQWPLMMRQWKQGDSFHPLGSSGSKKISDFLIDAKVNLQNKRSIFILEKDNSILCILDYRIAEAYRVTNSTQWILHIYKEENNA